MTIAVAHGTNDKDKAALQEGARLAMLSDEPLAVLRVVAGADQPPPPEVSLADQLTSELQNYPGLVWKIYQAPEKFDTAEALLDLATSVDATMLVIGGRRRTAVGKLLLGSTLQRVLLEATIPVLTVKAEV